MTNLAHQNAGSTPDAKISDKLSDALAYAAKNWPVLPLRGKTPLIARGLHSASTDAETIRAWWQTWPDANIGIRTGQPGGLYVIDVDGDKGNASLAELVATHGHVPATLINVTGNGHHYCFTAARPIRCSQSAIAPGIDTRGEDGYIVAPPSIHPTTGQAYAWEDVNAEPAELPDWLRPPERPATPAVTHPPRIRQAASDTDRTARASAYLATMGAAIEGSGGHSRLYAAATAMAWGFDLGRDGACDILWREFNPRCAPPWDYANPGQRREFERKVDQALAGNHDNPRGWLADSPGASMGLGTVEHGAGIVEAILATEAAKADSEARDTLARIGPAVHAGGPSQLSIIRQAAEQAPGHVGAICAWINATAIYPQPILTLANVLPFWGAVVGRKVRDAFNGRTNIYTFGVAPSGSGKDHSRQSIKRIAQAAGLADALLAGEDIASDSGLRQAVAGRPSSILQTDEVGHFVGGANRSNAAAHQAAVPVELTKLYSSAGGIMLGKELKTESRVDIDQPNVCLYGTTNPHTLYEALTAGQVRDGFLARVLVFRTDDPYPRATWSTPTDPPATVIDAVAAWHELSVPPPEGVTGDVEKHLTAWQITVPTDPDAEAMFREFDERIRQQMARQPADELGLNSILARAREHARKVALTIASSCSIDNPRIDAGAADWSIRLVDALTRDLIESVASNVAENRTASDRQRVLKIIRGASEHSISRGELSKAVHWLNSKQINDVVATLIESEEIVATQGEGGSRGRKPTVYVATGRAAA